MRTVGILLLLLSVGMLVLVGTIAADNLTEEAQINNSTDANTASGMIKPILMVMGCCALILGVVLAINAFR